MRVKGRRVAHAMLRSMKLIEIRRDPDTRRLWFQVREDHQIVWNELSPQIQVRKLRRRLRRTYGRSVRLSGLGA